MGRKLNYYARLFFFGMHVVGCLIIGGDEIHYFEG